MDAFPPRFERTVALYGPEGFARLRRGGALVVGLGGVGAHCVVALARSGIGRLKLLDFDQVSTSSLNRHPLAAPDDVGRLKTEILVDWIRRSCPDTEAVGVVARVEPETIADLLPPTDQALYPVLIDCIDSVTAKVALLAHGVEHGWQVLSSQGAAGKRDGGLVRGGDLFAVQGCPLARAVRRQMRRQGFGPGQVEAVWSTEEPVPPAPRGSEPRRQPSNQMLPGIFGFALAARAAAWLSGGGQAPPPAQDGASEPA